MQCEYRVGSGEGSFSSDAPALIVCLTNLLKGTGQVPLEVVARDEPDGFSRRDASALRAHLYDCPVVVFDFYDFS